MDMHILRRRLAQRGMEIFAGEASAAAPHEPLPAAGIHRILICRNSHSLGNTLLITPLVREIAQVWPGAEIDIVTRNGIAPEIFCGHPNVRRAIVLPRRGLRHPLQLARGLRAILGARYDLAIDTDPRSQTGRALLLRSHARYKLGFTGGGKSGAISHGIDPAGAPRHNGQFPVWLLRQGLRRREGLPYPPLDLCLSEAERSQGKAMLDALLAEVPGGSRGAIGIFANATGPKLLPRQWWRDFMPAIQTHFAGRPLIELIPASGESMLDDRFPAFFASSPRRLARLLSQLSMLICLDNGVMHLARASGTPTTAIFTISNMIGEWGPYGEGALVIDGEGASAQETANRLVAELR